jgi:asparagine synthase (glutamine-hydrolysing)
VADSQLENADELNDLLGTRLRDDADLIAALVSRYGIAGLERLRGYFAIALWMEHERAVLLACDHVGFRIIHYTLLPRRLAFCTDYKALLGLADFVPEPDREAIQQYLATTKRRLGHTLLARVGELTAGQALLWKDGRIETQRYWQPRVHPVSRSVEGHATEIRRAFLNVVRRQCQPYSRIGLTMSGGLDAPSVLAAVRHVKPEVPVSTFTIGYGEDDPEIVGARRAAEYFGSDHHELTFQPESIPDDLPRLIWLMEDCVAREEALLQFQILREAGKHVPMAMGGHGGDTLFGGMPRHRLVRFAGMFPMFEVPLAEFYQFTQGGAGPTTWLGRALKRAVYHGEDVPPPKVFGSSGSAKVTWPTSINDAAVKGVSAMSSLRYVESARAAARIAYYEPFLDPDFINLALTVPDEHKVNLREQKVILRRAMGRLLPREIAKRPKALQRVRHDEHLSDIVDRMADDLLSPETVRRRGFVDAAYVANLRRRPGGAAYPTEWLYRLWTLVCLEIWARQFLDALGPFPFS